MIHWLALLVLALLGVFAACSAAIPDVQQHIVLVCEGTSQSVADDIGPEMRKLLVAACVESVERALADVVAGVPPGPASPLQLGDAGPP